MFTTLDKAIAAILGGIVSALVLTFGLHLDWLTPDVISTISVVIAGLLAYVVPNKPTAAQQAAADLHVAVASGAVSASANTPSGAAALVAAKTTTPS